MGMAMDWLSPANGFVTSATTCMERRLCQKVNRFRAMAKIYGSTWILRNVMRSEGDDEAVCGVEARSGFGFVVRGGGGGGGRAGTNLFLATNSSLFENRSNGFSPPPPLSYSRSPSPSPSPSAPPPPPPSLESFSVCVRVSLVTSSSPSLLAAPPLYSVLPSPSLHPSPPPPRPTGPPLGVSVISLPPTVTPLRVSAISLQQ